jgi:hypothetical protein
MKMRSWLGLLAAALVLGAAAFYAYQKRNEQDSSSRVNALEMMPADASAVLFADFGALRTAPFVKQLFAWAPKPQADPDYAQFIKETNFDYERDLDRIAIAFVKHEQDSTFFAVADGRFDRQKISDYATKTGTTAKSGTRQTFSVPVTESSKAIAFTFLRSDRIVLTDGGDLSGTLGAKKRDEDRAEWRSRFERLAGSPIFTVIRQDAAAGTELAKQAPGGLRSPQLSSLLDQLQWITLAGKPENDRIRVVAEGECATEATTRQLADLLNGVLVLAEAGLNDAKTRQHLDPAARAAYLELLKSADISRIDRSDTKSVRLSFEVTPAFLEAAHRASSAQPDTATRKTAPGNARSSRKGHT